MSEADWTKKQLLDRVGKGLPVDTPEWAAAASKAATLDDFVTMLAWIVEQECESLRKREGGDLRRLCMLLKVAVEPIWKGAR